MLTLTGPISTYKPWRGGARGSRRRRHGDETPTLPPPPPRPQEKARVFLLPRESSPTSHPFPTSLHLSSILSSLSLFSVWPAYLLAALLLLRLFRGGDRLKWKRRGRWVLQGGSNKRVIKPPPPFKSGSSKELMCTNQTDISR